MEPPCSKSTGALHGCEAEDWGLPAGRFRASRTNCMPGWFSLGRIREMRPTPPRRQTRTLYVDPAGYVLPNGGPRGDIGLKGTPLEPLSHPGSGNCRDFSLVSRRGTRRMGSEKSAYRTTLSTIYHVDVYYPCFVASIYIYSLCRRKRIPGLFPYVCLNQALPPPYLPTHGSLYSSGIIPCRSHLTSPESSRDGEF